MEDYLGSIESLIKEICDLKYQKLIKCSHEYICEHGNAFKEIDGYERVIKYKSRKLSQLLDEYVGVKKYNVLGITYHVKQNKIYEKDYGWGKELRINVVPLRNRQYSCVMNLFNRLYGEKYLKYYYCGEWEVLSKPMGDKEDERE